MGITFYSICYAVWWCSVLVLAFCILRRRGRAKQRFASVTVPIVLYALVMLRTVLPLDFPYAIILPDKWFYPRFYRWMNAERFTVGQRSFSVVTVLIGVWAAVACLEILWYSVQYFRVVRRIRKYARPAGEPVQTVFRKVAGEEKRQIAVAVYTAPHIEIPHGIGAFRKLILLPQQPYSEEELYYILKHEYTHFRNHDIWMKQITAFFCIIFWWNPIVQLLKQDIGQALELRCDKAVVKRLDKGGRIAYLKTIAGIVRGKSARSAPVYGSTALPSEDNADLQERFHAIMGPEQPKANARNRALVVGFAIAMVISYATILQPCTDAPASTEPNTVDIEPDNSYILHRDGEYWIYIENCLPTQITEEFAGCLAEANIRIYEE